MQTIYVLLMLWASDRGGLTVVQQEFRSIETCEVARIAMAKAHDGNTATLRAQGCFKK